MASWERDAQPPGPPSGRPPWFGAEQSDPGRAGRAERRRLWIPVVFAFLVQLPAVGIALGHRPEPPPVLAAVLGIAAALALLLRRRIPGLVVPIIGLLAATAIAFGEGPPFAAVPLAIAVVGGVGRGVRAWVWGTLAGIAIVIPIAAYAVSGSNVSIIRPLVIAVLLCLLVGVGEAFRSRRERFRELSRRESARRQSEAEAERLRIARELHDVIAHSLSQISVQAGVGLHLFDTRPDRARESLVAIRETSGQALEEVRGVLGFLRGPGEQGSRSPAPDLARLPSLVDSFQKAGLEVRLENALGEGMPEAVQLAVYRIVQESLTNSVRHSAATTVTVRLSESSDGYLVTTQDNGRGAAPGAPEGRGLIGMRERAELLGGTLSATNPAEGGFLIEARIPRGVPR
jgi:signal transduction histidine kinase